MVTATRMTGVEWTTVRAQEPGSTAWLHSGIALLDGGRAAYAAVGGRAIVVRDLASGDETSVALPIVEAHGITRVADAAGERLWIADPGRGFAHGRVLAVTLEGVVVRELPTPAPDGGIVDGWRPTSVAVVAAGERAGDLWIADGYGHGRVSIHTPEGVTAVEEADGVHFDCPHGLVVDTRRETQQIVVADRGNRRLVFVGLDGVVDRVVTDPVMTSPSSLAVRGDTLVVTDLYGALLAVDADDRVTALLGDASDRGREGWPNRVVDGETVAPVLADGRLNSPHGVDVAANGDVYLTEWLFGGRVVRLRFHDDGSGSA